jgi:hypothetical protein
MKGVVKMMQRRGGLAAIETEHGDYTVIENLSSLDLELGDVISGQLYSLGGQELVHVRSGMPFSVFIQDFHNTKEVAHQTLSRT